MNIFILKCRNIETELTTNVVAYKNQEDAKNAVKIAKEYDEKRGVTFNHWYVNEIMLVD